MLWHLDVSKQRVFGASGGLTGGYFSNQIGSKKNSRCVGELVAFELEVFVEAHDRSVLPIYINGILSRWSAAQSLTFKATLSIRFIV